MILKNTQSEYLDKLKLITNNYKFVQTLEPVNVTFIRRSRYNVPKACFNNAFKFAASKANSFYVLGYLCFMGICIEHAWVMLSDGTHVDTTLNPSDRGADSIYVMCVKIAQSDLHKSLIKNSESVDMYFLNKRFRKFGTIV